MPLTRSISKQLLPVHDKPMIYYSLSTLMLAGIDEILVIVDPLHRNQFEVLLGDGSELGISLTYQTQTEPRGVADSLIIAEEFIAGSEGVVLALGDNIFYGIGLGSSLEFDHPHFGAMIMASWVQNPQEYGVIDFGPDGRPVALTEKPERPHSNFAVPGLYFYDNRVTEIAKSLKPSARGELEITDVNRIYLQEGSLSVKILPRGTTWMDAGTLDSLTNASEYVRTVEKRQGLKIGCPEEIAWRLGHIGDDHLVKLAQPLRKSGYGDYLLGLLAGRKT